MTQASSSSLKYPITTYLAVAVLLLLPVYYIRFSLLGVPTNALEVLILLTVLSLLMYRPNLRINPLNVFLPGIGLLMTGLFLGVVVAVEKDLALGAVKGWFIIPLLYAWVVAKLLDQRSVPLFVTALFINTIVVSLYTLGQRFELIPLLSHQAEAADLMEYAEQGRALAFFESPNYVAMYLTPPFVFLAIYCYRQRGYQLALLLPILAIYLSGSRAAIITFLLLVALALVRPLLKRGVGYLLAGGVGLIGLLWIYLVRHINFNGVDTLRLAIWQVALDLIAQHPITGIGARQFMTYFQSSAILQPGLQAAAEPYALHPHNLYLNLWLSGGLVAVAGLIAIIVAAYKLIRQNQEPDLVAVAAKWALVAILLHGLLDSTYFKNDLSVLAWLFLAFLAYGSVVSKTSKPA